MKVAVIGSSGLLGTAVCNSALRRGYQLLPYANSRTPKLSSDQEVTSLNLLNEEKLTREFLDQWPDAIVNCAAISSPDDVDQSPDIAKEINVNSVYRLALIASHIGARFIHISTDMVFDGHHSPYRSTDMPNPLSEYGIQKLHSEKKVLSACDENVVVLRVTLINGNSSFGDRSQHEKILRSLAAGKQVTLFEDEIRQPCSAENVADVIVELLERPQLNGLFHWSGAEEISRYALGVQILEHFGIDPKKIVRESLKTSKFVSGPRPKHLSFVLDPLVSKIITKPLGIKDQINQLLVPNDLYSWYRDFADDPSRYVPKF